MLLYKACYSTGNFTTCTYAEWFIREKAFPYSQYLLTTFELGLCFVKKCCICIIWSVRYSFSWHDNLIFLALIHVRFCIVSGHRICRSCKHKLSRTHYSEPPKPNIDFSTRVLRPTIAAVYKKMFLSAKSPNIWALKVGDSFHKSNKHPSM